MKQPGHLLTHAGDDYLIVEGGYNDDTLTFTVLAAPGNERFPQDEGARPIEWCGQGEWFPVAKWAAGMVVFQADRHEQQSLLMDELIERHREERTSPPEEAWAVRHGGEFSSTLEDVLPMGLAAVIHDDRATAEEGHPPEELEAIHNTAVFLTHLAREGYAGAMWNGVMPVYFCIDEVGDLQFLRVRRTDDDRVEMEILAAHGEWERYEGAEEIEFLDHRDACDALLKRSVGALPILDWPDDQRLWSVGPDDRSPGVAVNEEDEVGYGLLFTTRELAEGWCEDVESDWGPFAVDDLSGLLAHPDLEGRGTLVNPGQHRVRSGVLWSDKGQMVLDSYSGFWRYEDGGFRPAD